MKGLIKQTLATAFLLLSVSCTNRARYEAVPEKEHPPHFPMRQYAKDQWDTYYRQPYTLYRIITLNGRTDSALVNFFVMDWGAILKTFCDADIGDPKFFGKYRMSMFDDNYTGNRSFVWEALEPDLFTRQLQVSIDPTTNHILSVYAETFRKETFHEQTQKLLYRPLRVIQIQEATHATFGGARSLRIEYRFLQDNDE